MRRWFPCGDGKSRSPVRVEIMVTEEEYDQMDAVANGDNREHRVHRYLAQKLRGVLDDVLPGEYDRVKAQELPEYYAGEESSDAIH